VRALLALAMLCADPASAAALLAVDGAYNRVREIARGGSGDEDEKALAGDLAAALAPLAALAAGAPKK
jgi:hypothetical protein